MSFVLNAIENRGFCEEKNTFLDKKTNRIIII